MDEKILSVVPDQVGAFTDVGTLRLCARKHSEKGA
jgi:hypothetical protein